MSQRQQAVLDAIRARDPRPTTAAQLAAELGIAEGALNITLRSLHRRRLIAPRPADRSPAWCLDRPSRDITAPSADAETLDVHADPRHNA